MADIKQREFLTKYLQKKGVLRLSDKSAKIWCVYFTRLLRSKHFVISIKRFYNTNQRVVLKGCFTENFENRRVVDRCLILSTTLSSPTILIVKVTGTSLVCQPRQPPIWLVGNIALYNVHCTIYLLDNFLLLLFTHNVTY